MHAPRHRLATLALLAWLAPWAPAPGAALHYETQTFRIGRFAFEVRVPDGMVLEILTPVRGPRMLTFHANGDLFAGSRAGAVYRFVPPYTRAQILVRLDDYPHSVAFRGAEIFVARTAGLYRAPYRPGQAQLQSTDLARIAALPSGGHDSRTVRVGPDKRVYVSLGISSNCSDEYLGASEPARRRGGVLVLDESASTPRLVPFASGLRNPVGFDWQPATGVMYASNNGPDHLGFDQPPEYFARLDSGSFHGMPWYQWDGSAMRRDPCVASDPPQALESIPAPAAIFPARNAPMGVAFVPPGALGGRFAGDAVVALHGSWGTPPSGDGSGHPSTRRPPKLVLVRFENGKAREVVDLVTGFQLADGRRWARPVGVAVGPDGALYFSSDAALEALYRLRAR